MEAEEKKEEWRRGLGWGAPGSWWEGEIEVQEVVGIMVENKKVLGKRRR